MDKFLDWLTTSSADPEEYSLTIKGILLQYAGIIAVALSLLHYSVTMEQITSTIGSAAAVLGTVLGIIGLGRKLYIQIKEWRNK